MQALRFGPDAAVADETAKGAFLSAWLRMDVDAWERYLVSSTIK